MDQKTWALPLAVPVPCCEADSPSLPCCNCYVCDSLLIACGALGSLPPQQRACCLEFVISGQSRAATLPFLGLSCPHGESRVFLVVWPSLLSEPSHHPDKWPGWGSPSTHPQDPTFSGFLLSLASPGFSFPHPCSFPPLRSSFALCTLGLSLPSLPFSFLWLALCLFSCRALLH